MATRSDISFDRVNRIITVAAPSTEVTIQDLLDTIRDWEDEPSQLNLASLATAGGKDSLGGGEFTGITLTLINDWRLAFQARTTIVEEGTISLANGDGTILTDASATFETNGVEVGAIVVNKTDGSAASVVDVVSETQLTLDGLTGGTDNDFDASDAYGVWNVISCIVSGGNLVAVNSFSNNPIFPTYATQVQIRQSAAPVQLLQSSTRIGSFVSG